MNLEKYPTFESWLKDVRFNELKELIIRIDRIGGCIREFTHFQLTRRYFIVFNFGSWRSEAIFKKNIHGYYVLESYQETTPLPMKFCIGDWVEL